MNKRGIGRRFTGPAGGVVARCDGSRRHAIVRRHSVFGRLVEFLGRTAGRTPHPGSERASLMPPAILDGDASRASCLRRASEQELVEVVDPSSPPPSPHSREGSSSAGVRRGRPCRARPCRGGVGRVVVDRVVVGRVVVDRGKTGLGGACHSLRVAPRNPLNRDGAPVHGPAPPTLAADPHPISRLCV